MLGWTGGKPPKDTMGKQHTELLIAASLRALHTQSSIPRHSVGDVFFMLVALQEWPLNPFISPPTHALGFRMWGPLSLTQSIGSRADHAVAPQLCPNFPSGGYPPHETPGF